MVKIWKHNAITKMRPDGSRAVRQLTDMLETNLQTYLEEKIRETDENIHHSLQTSFWFNFD